VRKGAEETELDRETLDKPVIPRVTVKSNRGRGVAQWTQLSASTELSSPHWGQNMGRATLTYRANLQYDRSVLKARAKGGHLFLPNIRFSKSRSSHPSERVESASNCEEYFEKLGFLHMAARELEEWPRRSVKYLTNHRGSPV
jgi:hypothetical protein